MRCASVHKVCFKVGGAPVILRALHTCQERGINHHIVVIGARADQVVSTVGKHFSNVSLTPEALAAIERKLRTQEASVLS